MKKYSNKLNFFETVSLAVGTMIGASIFSIFGTGVELAGTGMYLSILIAGFITLLISYSYIKFSSKIVSNEGPIAFIKKTIKKDYIINSLKILLWFSYIISIALFLKGLSGYLLPLFGFNITLQNHIILSFLILFLLIFIAVHGDKDVGFFELTFVLIKLTILFSFIIVGLKTLNINNLILKNNTSFNGIIHASTIFFLSYIGFGILTNSSENIVNPKKTIPKAIITSVILVMIIYFLITIVTLGNLSLNKILLYKENAIAEAAKPFLGSFGFLLLSIAAIISITTSLNATLFSGGNLAQKIETLNKKSKHFRTKALLATSILGFLFSIFFNILSIASMINTFLIIIYILVIYSHIKNIKTIGGNFFIVYSSFFSALTLLLLLVYYQYKTNIHSLYTLILLLFLTLLIEYYKYNVVKTKKF